MYPELSSLNDGELFERIRAGDTSALDALAERYIQKLVASAILVTGSLDLAQDAVQETFIRIWDRREQIQIHTNVAVYLIRAVRHQAESLMRREGAQHRLGSRIYSGDPSEPSHNLEASMLNAERDTAVRQALAELPPKAQEVMLLRVDFGLTNAEIADALGIALTTVKTHIVRATKTLAARLTQWKAS